MINYILYIKNKLAKEGFLRILRYIIIGALTTGISFGIYWIGYYVIKINLNIANIFSVICAVCFAYIMNKNFVFKSKCNTIQELIKEIFIFFLSRAITIGIEVIGVFLLFSYLNIEAILSKAIISILVLILNYILSQVLIFKNT